MMRDCWMEKPVDRPNFTAVMQRLDYVIESHMASTVGKPRFNLPIILYRCFVGLFLGLKEFFSRNLLQHHSVFMGV